MIKKIKHNSKKIKNEIVDLKKISNEFECFKNQVDN